MRKKFFIELLLCFCAFFCILGFSGCVENRESFAESAAKQVVSNILKSPSSARWNEVSYMENDGNGKYVIYIDVEAINSFGAYLRTKYFVIVSDLNLQDKTFKYNKSFAIWECSGKNDSFNLGMIKNLNNYGQSSNYESNNSGGNQGSENNNPPEIRNVSVSFFSDGQYLQSTTYKKGTQVNAISNPIKNNYTFLGWYIGESKIDFPYTVNNDTIFTAKWIGNDCIYMLEGDLTEYSIKYGDLGIINIPQAKEGYIFSGWFYYDTQITNSSGKMISPWNYNTKITLKPKYDLIKYVVTFSANMGGAVNGQSQVKYECSVLNNFEAPEITVVPKKGYRFVKWSDGVTTLTRHDTNIHENKEIYAEFIRCWDIIFTAQTGGTIQGDANQIVDKGQSSAPITAVPNAGYEFVRWEYVEYSNTHYFWNATAVMDSNTLNYYYSNYINAIEVVAIFKKLTYTVEYSTQYDSGNYWEHPEYGVGYLKYEYSTNNGDAYPNNWSPEGVTHAMFNISIDNNLEVPEITVVPKKGYRFVKWSDGSTNPTRHDININSDLKIIAEFELA